MTCEVASQINNVSMLHILNTFFFSANITNRTSKISIYDVQGDKWKLLCKKEKKNTNKTKQTKNQVNMEILMFDFGIL